MDFGFGLQWEMIRCMSQCGCLVFLLSFLFGCFADGGVGMSLGLKNLIKWVSIVQRIEIILQIIQGDESNGILSRIAN